MMRIALRWLLVLSVALSTLGTLPAPALAQENLCSGKPFAIAIPLVVQEPQGLATPVRVRVQVAECAGQEWSGNIRMDLTHMYPDCNVYLPGQPLSLRAGDVETVEFAAELPCTGTYTATATLYDTVDRQSGWGSVAIRVKTRTKPGV